MVDLAVYVQCSVIGGHCVRWRSVIHRCIALVGNLRIFRAYIW